MIVEGFIFVGFKLDICVWWDDKEGTDQKDICKGQEDRRGYRPDAGRMTKVRGQGKWRETRPGVDKWPAIGTVYPLKQQSHK